MSIKLNNNDWMAIGLIDGILLEYIKNKKVATFKCMQIEIQPCEMPEGTF